MANTVDGSGEPYDPKAICKTNLDNVMALIRAHDSYTPPSEKEPLPGTRPKFDAISRYGLAIEKEDALWKIEAERLLRAVSDFDTPLLFESPLPQWSINKAEFDKLSELSNQALHCLNICIHDNQLLLFESMRDLFDAKSYSVARGILSRAFDPVDLPGRGGRPGGREHPADLSIHGKTAQVFCAFVDYATAAVARLALQGIPTEFWHTRALTGLAKTSAKMKFLFSDLEKFALQSLEDGQDVLAMDEVMDALRSTGFDTSLDVIGGEERKTGREDLADAADVHRLLNPEKGNYNVYFSEMALMATWTVDTLRAIFFFFQSSSRSGYAIDAFDICGLVYKTGLKGLPTLVYQDRDGELAGSSSREMIRLSHTGFRMLSQVARELERTHRRASTRPGTGADGVRTSHARNDGSGALLVLEFEEEQKQQGPPDSRPGSDDHSSSTGSLNEKSKNPISTYSAVIDLETMGDLASALVPLLCAHPMTIINLAWAMEVVTGISSITHTINFNALQSPKFTAFASLRTNVYERDVKPIFEDSDARPLSRSLIAHNRLRTYDGRQVTGTKVWEGLGPAERKDAVEDSEQRVQELEKQFGQWVIEEKAIVVTKRLYVLSWLLVCAVFVIGGIMVGVFLGTRLKGVDPFNITVYAWVLAGFLLLVAKSAQVAEWPWRDFLKGNVPCRSVSELQTVTGVDAQEIIEYLLSTELYTILVTKGPYNRPFVRKNNDGGDGFSIDIKSNLRTLLASGIIVVKVAGRQGPALLCMDLRRGAPGRSSISHSDKIDKDDFILGCFEFPEAFDDGQEVPLIPLATGWTKILGIYHRPQKVFR